MRWLLLIVYVLFSLNLFARSEQKGTDDFFKEVDTLTVSEGFIDSVGGNLYQHINSSSQELMHNKVFWYTFEQNKKVFQWQYTSSIIIFFMVITIVVCGLVMSYQQFRFAIKRLEKNHDNDSDEKFTEIMKANMQIGKEGVKINTAVVGLIILSLSLAFLFLYLKYVYPISIVKIA